MVVVTAENDGGLPQDKVAASILYGRYVVIPENRQLREID